MKNIFVDNSWQNGRLQERLQYLLETGMRADCIFRVGVEGEESEVY
jgi:hypothetical protein